MENTEETRSCRQCHKEVADANFSLHETHCRRFLCLCPDCDEAVPRDQLNEHREEQHSQVRCSKCNQKMERCHLMDHESDECVERLQPCHFCELEVPAKELDGHSLVCGSRTELCKDCGRYVKLRDQAEHGLTCSNTDNDSSPPPATSSASNMTAVRVRCGRCMETFPAEDIDEHELECLPAVKWDYEEDEEEEDEDDFSWQVATPRVNSTFKGTSLSDRVSRGPRGGDGDPNQISACPHCNLALPLFTLRWHEAKCQVYVHLK